MTRRKFIATAAGALAVARRDTGEKVAVPTGEIVSKCVELMTEIQQSLWERALAFRDANTRRVDTWAEFEEAFSGEGGAGFIVAHWDGTSETEELIAQKTKATIRCIPLTPLIPSDNEPGVCVLTGNPSKQRVVFARAY